jgi:hypothetical protein
MIIEGVFHRGERSALRRYLTMAMYMLIAMSGGFAMLFFTLILAYELLQAVSIIL